MNRDFSQEQRSIAPSGLNAMIEDDVYGYLIAASFQVSADGFASYEIYNFLEETLKTELEDLSVFRNPHGMPTGIVVAQLRELVSATRLARIHTREFKGSPVKLRLFTSKSDFHKFIRNESANRLEKIKLKLDESVPLIYACGFPNFTDDQILDFFSQTGQIEHLTKYPYKDGYYYTIEYSNTGEAITTSRTFRDYRLGDQTLQVGILYKSAAERTFAVHHCPNFDWLKTEIKYFGVIEDFKITKDDDAYIMMDSIESAKAACLLLNRRIYNDVQITTNFIDYDYFKRVK